LGMRVIVGVGLVGALLGLGRYPWKGTTTKTTRRRITKRVRRSNVLEVVKGGYLYRYDLSHA